MKDGVWSDIPFAQIPQGLCDQAAGATRQREISSGVPSEHDLALAQIQGGRRSVRLVDQAGGHLGAETELIGGHLGRRQEAEMAAPRDRRDDGIRGGPRFPEQRMIVWGIVDTTGNAADFPIADETAERHPHGTRIA